jgi:ATP-dependent Clp protease ATP-binding subunit ClpB
LNDVAERLRNKHITLDVDDAARQWLAEQGYSDMYGARAIARVVRSAVLQPLAKKLLKGTIRDGEAAVIRVSEDGLSLHIKDNHSPDSEAQTSK